MSYQIITDSCCDLTEAQLQQLQVSCANLTVLYKGENHRNFSDPTAVKAFYDELREGVTATTAAANPQDWEDAIVPALEQGQDALVLAFSSGMSTTYQSAVIAAEELMERFIRGDISRNTDGSGLGLNIAKNLMEIQNGQLQMIVDGDLFKVTLIFPDGR